MNKPTIHSINQKELSPLKIIGEISETVTAEERIIEFMSGFPMAAANALKGPMSLRFGKFVGPINPDGTRKGVVIRINLEAKDFLTLNEISKS